MFRPASQEEQERRAVPVLEEAADLVKRGARLGMAIRAAQTEKLIEMEYARRALRRHLGIVDIDAWAAAPGRTRGDVVRTVCRLVSELKRKHGMHRRGGWAVSFEAPVMAVGEVDLGGRLARIEESQRGLHRLLDGLDAAARRARGGQ